MVNEVFARLSDGEYGRVTVQSRQSRFCERRAHPGHLHKPRYRCGRLHVLVVERVGGVHEYLEEYVIW